MSTFVVVLWTSETSPEAPSAKVMVLCTTLPRGLWTLLGPPLLLLLPLLRLSACLQRPSPSAPGTVVREEGGRMSDV
jgi:hypothetical protein